MKLLEGKYEAKVEFPRGEGAGAKRKKTFCGGRMDIFWNYSTFPGLHADIKFVSIYASISPLTNTFPPISTCFPWPGSNTILPSSPACITRFPPLVTIFGGFLKMILNI